MTSAASQGDRDAMRSLYMPGAVPEEHMERQIQENVDIWGKSQLDSFKKKGLNIRTSTKNGVKTKSVECSYGIKTEDGQRFTAILNRMESSDGNQGIISFIIRDNVSLAPQGTLRSISHWNVFQWGLFLLSLIMIFSTIATAVICYRQNPRYKWGWIILILIAYLSMGFLLFVHQTRGNLRSTGRQPQSGSASMLHMRMAAGCSGCSFRPVWQCTGS